MIKNRTTIFLWAILLWRLSIGISCANAGEVRIAVSDAKANPKCVAHLRGDDPEMTVYSATSDELETYINNFMNRSMQNRDLIDAALCNAGIVFCGSAEAKKFAQFILRKLDTS